MAAILDLFELDLNDPDKISIPLNFSSVDYRDIGKRKGTFSRTIKMPSTKRNDAFFGLSFEVTNEGLFDDKIKIPITINEIEFLGFMQLKGVSVIEGRTESYSVNIFSDMVDWSALVGSGSIRDLNHLTSHVLSEQNVRNSWNNDPLVNQYVYPVINYGNYITSSTDINLTKFLPSFFVYPLIVQIFKEAGYTFLGEYLSKSNLRNLILPFMGDKFFTTDSITITTEISTLDLTVKTRTRASGSSQTLASGSGSSVNVPGSFIMPVTMSEVLMNNREHYNESTGVYVAPQDDTYNLSLDVDSLQYDFFDVGSSFETVIVEVLLSITNGFGTSNTSLYQNVYFSNVGDISFNVNTNRSLSKNDAVRFLIKIDKVNTGGLRDVILVDGTMDFTPANNLIVTELEDDEKAEAGAVVTTTTETQDAILVDHKSSIQDIKKIDLLREVMVLGNYRVVTDNISKTVDFIPEDSFFRGQPKDWTYKKDNSKKIDISLVRNDGARILEFNYSNDSTDKMITDTEGNFRMTKYASESIEMESEHRTGTQVIHKSIFSATIDEFGLPVMMKDVETPEFEADFANRLLLWGGMRSGSYKIFGTQASSYPYSYFAGSNFSIAFNRPFGNLKSAFGGRAKGIVELQYTATIRKLNNAKLYKGYFWLDSYDIATLDFGRPIIVNDVQYYINRIIDYRVGANKPTQVELISRV